ncbi:hypothetical protein ACFOZY_13990 [Chungangia koreensis]|uniref:Uncharacterized protein n=1 Tax=Chungangia koreensis TaxID=752657 RepID=A0ABV8X6J1_9LACT
MRIRLLPIILRLLPILDRLLPIFTYLLPIMNKTSNRFTDLHFPLEKL